MLLCVNGNWSSSKSLLLAGNMRLNLLHKIASKAKHHVQESLSRDIVCTWLICFDNAYLPQEEHQGTERSNNATLYKKKN